MAVGTGTVNFYDTSGNRGDSATVTFTVDENGANRDPDTPANNAAVSDEEAVLKLTFSEPVFSNSERHRVHRHIGGRPDHPEGD